MAEKILEREYVIPLRKALLRVPQYRRSGRAIKAIKKFIAKHMKVADRDVKNVKLDVYFNNEVWFRGRANPPTKVKVKARKEGDIVHVEFVDVPEHVKFLKAKHEQRHKKTDKKAPVSEEKPAHAETLAKTEEQKKDESEKEKSVAEFNIKEAEKAQKAQKHITKHEETHHPTRMALKK